MQTIEVVCTFQSNELKTIRQVALEIEDDIPEQYRDYFIEQISYQDDRQMTQDECTDIINDILDIFNVVIEIRSAHSPTYHNYLNDSSSDYNEEDDIFREINNYDHYTELEWLIKLDYFLR